MSKSKMVLEKYGFEVFCYSIVGLFSLNKFTKNFYRRYNQNPEQYSFTASFYCLMNVGKALVWPVSLPIEWGREAIEQEVEEKRKWEERQEKLKELKY